jgi:hypothetical protein
MIIRIALLLIFASFAAFISVDLLLRLAVPGLPEIMTQLGLSMLLSAFALLLITGLFVIIKPLPVSITFPPDSACSGGYYSFRPNRISLSGCFISEHCKSIILTNSRENGCYVLIIVNIYSLYPKP